MQLADYCQLERRAGGMVARFSGRVDSMNFVPVLRELERLAVQERPARLLLNLGSVDFLQSTALGQLVTLNSHLKEFGSRLQLCGLAAMVRQVLSVSQIDRLLAVYETEEAACGDWPAAPPQVLKKPEGLARLDEELTALGRGDKLAVKPFARARDAEPARHDWGVEHLFPASGLPAGQGQTLSVIEIYTGCAQAFHRHPHQDEAIVVREGAVETWVARDRQVLTPGDAAFVPRGAAHAVFNDTSEKAVFVSVRSPIAADLDAEDLSQVEPWSSLLHGRGYRGLALERHPDVLVARCTRTALVNDVGLNEFQSSLNRLIANESPQGFVLDLSEVKHLSSAAIGILLSLWKRREADGRPGAVCGLRPELRKVFEITRVAELIPLYADTTGAVAAVRDRVSRPE